MLSGRRLDLLDPSHRPIRIVALADDMLGRNGRMVDAITAVGPGVLAEAFPFRLGLQGHEPKPLTPWKA